MKAKAKHQENRHLQAIISWLAMFCTHHGVMIRPMSIGIKSQRLKENPFGLGRLRKIQAMRGIAQVDIRNRAAMNLLGENSVRLFKKTDIFPLTLEACANGTARLNIAHPTINTGGKIMNLYESLIFIIPMALALLFALLADKLKKERY